MAGISFRNVFTILVLTFSQVSTWTVDLPEIRKYLFEKNDHYKNDGLNKDNKEGQEIKGQYYYTNRESNSPHHDHSKHYEDIYETNPYAKEYGYQSYMEKKVHTIVYHGSKYLDGLHESLENYTRFLEACNRMNRTRSSNSTSWRPASESNSTSSFNMTACENATRASEHVRRLSELALWSTRQLQDIAYSRRYQKGDIHDLTLEENELILKLAWFLDRLAHYTGYDPDPKHLKLKPTSTTQSPPTPTALSIMNASEDVKRLMMECLQQQSELPATVRCAYPAPMPDFARMILNISDSFAPSVSMDPSSSNIREQVLPLENELLITSESFAPILTPVNKPSLSEATVINFPPKLSRRKRSDTPAVNFLKHFTKTRAWLNDNNSKNNGEYEVKNHLEHAISKRAIDKVFYKKIAHLKTYKKPEDPFQDLSKYIKHKTGVNYVKDGELAAKLQAFLDKMHSKTLKSSKTPKKSFVQKRSIKFEQDVDKPRISEDPQKDISYYVKNKEGTNYNNDLNQALQVRAGLEQVFQTGNIEVVRRFGSNYNPLVPAPFYFAIMKSAADNL